MFLLYFIVKSRRGYRFFLKPTFFLNYFFSIVFFFFFFLKLFFLHLPSTLHSTMDVGQNLHKFFSTEHQPELMKLIMKLHELPLWQAIPQQHLMEHLYKWTSFPTFNTATRKTVVAYIKEAYTLTDIEEIHTNLDWVWMYCYPDYLNNDTSMKKLLDKIQDSQYSRIDAAWFNRQVR